MKQEEARQRARELGGIAVSAHAKPSGGWRTGGWPNQKGETWIVVSVPKKGQPQVVLDDRRTPGDEIGDARRGEPHGNGGWSSTPRDGS